MTMKTVLATLLLVLMLTGLAMAGASSIDPNDRGPAISSPPVEIAPNGDRVSPYPPYFRPNK